MHIELAFTIILTGHILKAKALELHAKLSDSRGTSSSAGPMKEFVASFG